MLHANSLRSIGWVGVIAMALAGLGVLTLRVNAVKSEVKQAERRIVALQTEKMMLETEFEARASQQQLAIWNDVDFGYQPPNAGQFLEGERKLAALGTPRAADAPAPIRVAVADPAIEADSTEFPSMVSPLTGKAFAAEVPDAGNQIKASAADLGRSLTSGAARVKLPASMGSVE